MTITNEFIARYYSMKSDGYSRRKIAAATGVAESTIRGWEKSGKLNQTEEAQMNPEPKESKYKGELAKFLNNEGADKLITKFKYPIVTSSHKADGCNHFVVPDTQVKPGIDMSYLSWIGEYIVDRKPDVIIHLGDHADFPSLSSYDKGKRSAEGKRVVKDINAAIEGMERLLKPLHDYQQSELEQYGEIRYKPKMIFTLGNHCERLKRHIDVNPELHGLLSYDSLLYKDAGWEVYDYLEPKIQNGVIYCHFMANPFTGKPYGGTAANILKHVGESFTVGHKQCLDIATRNLPASGRQQWAIVAGAGYPHAETYKGYGGNEHWRGVIVKHYVVDGGYNPMFVDLDYLERRFG